MGLKQDAIRRDPPKEIDCDSFLELHTDYLDGFLTLEEARLFDVHAASCASCGRYDRVVRRGLLLVRNAGEIQPSDDFHERLLDRLREPEPKPSVLNPSAAFVIAAVLTVVSLIPVLRFADVWGTDDNSAIATESQLAAENDEWWRLTGAVPLGATSSNPFGVVAAPPDGEYSPLLIQAPLIEPAPAAPRLVTYPVPLVPNQ